MKSNQGKSKVRHFHLKLDRESDIKDFDRFQMKTIFDGREMSQTVMEAVRNSFGLSDSQPELVHEAELLQKLRSSGHARTRSWLVNMRDADLLKDGSGNRLWGTNGKGVVYDLHGMVRFVKSWSKNVKAGRPRKDIAVI